MATPNYSIPVFAAGDNVDLMGVYNVAMTTIDSELKKINDSIGTINSTLSTLNQTVNTMKGSIPNKSGSDEAFSVSDLAGAKITSTGFVYFESE